MELPKDEDQRKALKGLIEEAVTVKLKADALKLEMKDIQDRAKEDLGIKAKELNRRIKTRYMQLKAEATYLAEKENAGVEFVENEILFGSENS